MEKWIIFTLIYAVCNSFFKVSKKKATEISSIYEVLALFSTFSFVIVACTTKDAFNIEPQFLLIILLKSVVVIVAWILGMYVISKMTISLYSNIEISRVIFSIIMGCVLFNEKITVQIFIGIVIVLIGIILVNKVSNEEKEKKYRVSLILILLVSCLFNSISAIIDKKVMSYVTSSQLQFWFMLFMMVIYWIILLFKEKEFKIKNNYWILLTAIFLTIGDRCLFIANSFPQSKVWFMTILKQLSVIVSVILGKVIFKEKNIIKKIICSLIIILGVIIMFI